MMDQPDGVESMGFLFKKSVTRNVPVRATIKSRRRLATAKKLRLNPDIATVAEEIATWRDKSGDKHSGVVVDERVRMSSGVWMARYRDASGLLQEVSTGCRDKSNAAIFLANMEAMIERIKLGVVTETELDTRDAGDVEIATQIEAYLSSLKNKRGKGRRERISDSHLVNVRRSLFRIVNGCSFKSIRDIRRESVSQWVTDCLNDVSLDWSARTINSHIIEEVERLLAVARLRPVAEYGRAIVRKTADEMPSQSNSRSTWKRVALEFNDIEPTY